MHTHINTDSNVLHAQMFNTYVYKFVIEKVMIFRQDLPNHNDSSTKLLNFSVMSRHLCNYTMYKLQTYN